MQCRFRQLNHTRVDSSIHVNFLNNFVEYYLSSPLYPSCVTGNVNVKDRKITLVCMFAGNEVDELSCPNSNKVVKELSGEM